LAPAQSIALVLGTALLFGSGAAAYVLRVRARSRARLWRDAADAAPSPERSPSRLTRELTRAGWRSSAAPAVFVASCAISGLSALVLAAITINGQPLLAAADAVASVPVVGGPLARAVSWLPMLAGAAVAVLPWLWLRTRRAARMQAIERDLPLVLELLATLAESGLGFDSSLERVLDSEPVPTPLTEELRLYQAEVLGGGSRVACLQRLSNRVGQPTVTSAVAALVQAEEMGAGLADVLRPLADDFRLRRRERALARAEALPEKLVFPLVIGFLPSLLVWTLGPSFHQLFVAVDAIMRGGQ